MVRGAVVLSVLVALLSACIGLPDKGPVVDADVAGDLTGDPISAFDGRPPQPGVSRIEIVDGFLEAMMAWPISTNVAKQYLAEDAAEEWNPDEKIVYTELATPHEEGSSVSIRMRDASLLDQSGGWRGVLPADRSTLRFQLTVEDGEFRIIDPMDALVVRTDWFRERFRQASIYYFDPTARVLVPEPVFVPEGETFATNLVNALLAGLPARVRGIVQTFVPPHLTVGLSVPVTDGVASIDLHGDSQPTAAQAELLLAQLAATVGQEPTITAVRVSIGGKAVHPPGAGAQYDVSSADEFDPADIASTGILYGLQRGRIVAGSLDDLRAVDGPLGREPHQFASVSVAPVEDRVAAVSADGRQVVEAPLRSLDGTGVSETPVADGTVFSQPSWDASGRLWLLDRGPRGARVLVSDDKAEARVVDVPLVSGADARRVLVSRDGTLLIALVTGRTGDRLVASRIVLDSRGRVAQVVESAVIRP